MNAIDGRAALDSLFWRAEILLALYWLHGERLAEAVTAARLAEFLAADPAIVAQQMVQLVADGYLEAVRDSAEVPAFRLTTLGLHEGARSFHDEFAGLTRQAHFSCSPGCWCHDAKRAASPCPNTPRHELSHSP